MSISVADAREMSAFAAQLVAPLVPRDRATVITLSGELGAGKTTFAQGLALMLGIVETVNSPTFVLEKVYKLEEQPFDHAQGKKFTHLIHMDAYRLKSAHELRVLGWEEIVREPGNLIVLEWPERVESLIPPDAIRIRIDIVADGRIITINGAKESRADT